MPKACAIRQSSFLPIPLSPASFYQSHNSRLMATPSLYSYLIMLQDCNRNSNSCFKCLQGQQLLLPVAFPRKLTSQGSARSSFPSSTACLVSPHSHSHCHSPFSFLFPFTCISLIQLQTALSLCQRAMINVHLISI